MIDLSYMLQVALWLDDGAKSPYSEAELLRDAVDEIAQLRATNATQEETISKLIAALGKILDETLSHA